MTEKFKIDNKFIKKVANEAMKLASWIEGDAKTALDVTQDVFLRYMAFCRLRNTIKAVNNMVELSRHAILSGHVLAHPFLHTPEAKKCEWNEVKPQNHDFFIATESEDNESENEISIGDITDLFKKLTEDLEKTFNKK